MNEYTIGFTASGLLFVLAIYATLWMMGGRRDKWLRRFVGSSIMAVGVNVACVIMGIWEWYVLLLVATTIGGSCLGYGGKTFGEKLVRRLVFCLGNVSGAIIFLIMFKGAAINVFLPHMWVALVSVYFGLKNPIHAAAEEVFVCASLYLFLCAYPFISVAI